MKAAKAEASWRGVFAQPLRVAPQAIGCEDAPLHNEGNRDSERLSYLLD